MKKRESVFSFPKNQKMILFFLHIKNQDIPLGINLWHNLIPSLSSLKS